MRELVQGKVKFLLPGGQRAANRLLRRPPLRDYVSLISLPRWYRRRGKERHEEAGEVWQAYHRGGRGRELFAKLLPREGGAGRRGRAEVLREVVSVPHPEGTRVRLIGKNEIYRPGLELAGIEGTREMYHFVGANTPKCDAATTTDGLHEVDAKESVSGEQGVNAEEPISSGQEEVVVQKVIRKYRVKTRLASCFCSSCQISRYEECHINRTYPALVPPAMMNGEVKKTIIMDTGVEPVGVDEP